MTLDEFLELCSSDKKEDFDLALEFVQGVENTEFNIFTGVIQAYKYKFFKNAMKLFDDQNVINNYLVLKQGVSMETFYLTVYQYASEGAHGSPEKEMMFKLMSLRSDAFLFFLKFDNFYRENATYLAEIISKDVDLLEESIEIIAENIASSVSLVMKSINNSNNIKNKEVLYKHLIAKGKILFLPDNIKDVFVF